jgi:hypothetical protein
VGSEAGGGRAGCCVGAMLCRVCGVVGFGCVHDGEMVEKRGRGLKRADMCVCVNRRHLDRVHCRRAT